MIYIPKTPEEKIGIAKWIGERIKEKPPEVYEAIAVLSGDKLTGAFLYYNYLGTNINISAAFDSPKYVTRTSLKAALAYPFKQLRTKRITAFIKKGNRRSRKLVEGLGFKLEGVMRKSSAEGKDMCIYGLLEDEYQTGRFV